MITHVKNFNLLISLLRVIGEFYCWKCSTLAVVMKEFKKHTHVCMYYVCLYNFSGFDINEDVETRYSAILQDSRNIEKKIPVDRRKLERLIVGMYIIYYYFDYISVIMITEALIVTYRSSIFYSCLSQMCVFV